MSKEKLKKFIRRYRFMTYGLITFIGAAMIAYVVLKTDVYITHIHIYNVLMGIGCGILSTVLVTVILLALIPDLSDEKKELEEWGIVEIHPERSSARIDSKKLPKDILYFSAFGLSHFRAAANMDTELISSIQRGLKVRILTMDPNSIYLLEQEIFENNKEIRKDIEDLIKWVDRIRDYCNTSRGAKSAKGSIELEFYNSLPLDFFCRADEMVYVGPYIPGKPSGETITYRYRADSNGGKYYIGIFDRIWNNESTVKISSERGSILYLDQETAIESVLKYFCEVLQGRTLEKVIGVIAIFKGDQRRTFFSCNKIHEERHVCHGKNEGTVGKLLEMNKAGSISKCILFSDYKNKQLFAYKYEARKKNIIKVDHDIKKLENNEDTAVILAIPLFFNGEQIGAVTFDFARLPSIYEAKLGTLSKYAVGKEIDEENSKALMPIFKMAKSCGDIVISLLGQASVTKYKTLYEEEW